MRKRKLLCVRIICLSLTLIIMDIIMVCARANATEVLHLGATVPFQSRTGVQLKNILTMNADLLNKAGGLTVGGKTYTINYHIYDDKYDADTGRAAIEKLVFENKIKFNVGTFGSAPTLAMLSVTEPNKIPIFGGAASEKLLSPNVKYFLHTYPTKFNFAVVGAFHEIRPDIKSVLLCSYDDETGHTVVAQYEKAYRHFGIPPFPSLYFKRGETDFSRIATKAISIKPDLFNALGIVGAENLQLIKALRDAGFNGSIQSGHMSQAMVDDIVAKIGKQGAEGIYVHINDPTLPAVENKPPGIMEFRKNYETRYGGWETDGIEWCACWYTWLTAVKKANSIDPDKVMTVIDKGIEVSTPLGLGKFFARPDLGNNRYCDFAMVIRGGVIKDGKIVFLFERDADYMINAVEKVYGVKMRK